MDQTDLEAQSQTRKLRRGRHSASNWSSWASRLPADGTSASDCHWKTNPRPTHSVPHSHEHRRQDYGITEPVASCYSALNTYRPKHRAPVPPLQKSSHIPTSDQSYRPPVQQSVRIARNKLLATNNLAVVRNSYKDDVEDDEEDVNSAEDNVEEDAADEADEDQDDQPYEYNVKDYEEQEADDEVDDESDAFQAQLHRMMQHKVQKVGNHRSQPVRHPEQQQDLRKIQHHQHGHKVYQDQKSSRFYPQSSETLQPIAHDTSYGDAADVVSDDQHTPPWTPDPRRSTRRTSETHHAVPSWIQTRKSVDRNRDRANSPPVTAQEQHRYHRNQPQHQQAPQQQRHQLRKHKTSKPEIESLMMPQPSNPSTKKCCLCGGSAATVGSTRKDNCRLHECRGFTVKGPPGEDGEAEEQVVCGRCARRYNKEDLRLGCEVSSVPLYPEKSNRSRIHRSSTYNLPEDSQTVDEMLAAYASSQPRTSTLDYSMAPRERTRHSVQTARSPMRRSSYYDR